MVDHDVLEAHLTRLQLTAIRDQFDSLLDEAAEKGMTLREAVAFLVEREVARRDERRIEMAFKIVHFPAVRERASTSGRCANWRRRGGWSATNEGASVRADRGSVFVSPGGQFLMSLDTRAVAQTVEAVALVGSHPALDRARILAQQPGRAPAALTVGDQQQAVQPMVVLRLVRTANLLLYGQKRGLRTLDLQFPHCGGLPLSKSRNATPLCGNTYVVVFSKSNVR